MSLDELRKDAKARSATDQEIKMCGDNEICLKKLIEKYIKKFNEEWEKFVKQCNKQINPSLKI